MSASSAPVSAAPARLLVVGMGELVVSADPAVTLVTYALGSCLGLAVYDPVARVGGMLHAMLPSSEVDPARAAALPALFVDTGVPELFRACYGRGARKERLVVTIAGAGALSGEDTDQFRIGKRNLLMVRQLFWKNSVLVHGEDVGGSVSRTLSLNVGDGQVLIRMGSNHSQR
jgi:chemotaxis protein CheD